MLVGLHDETREILGLENDFTTFRERQNWDGWLQTLINGANTRLGKEFASYWEARQYVMDGKSIAEITVRMAFKPVFYDPGKNEFYVRIGNTTQMLDPKQTSDYIRENWG